MASVEQFITIADLSGGLNASASPRDVGLTDVTLAENVEWIFGNRMPRKRQGATADSLSSWSPTSCDITSLVTHTPANGLTAKELWAFTNKTATTIGRKAGGTTWAGVTPSPDDGPNGSIGSTQEVYGASYNNKLFLAFPNSADRMHVWDGTTLRRTSLATTAAATVADTGAGAYTATLRYYKVSFIELSGSTIIRRGELSGAVAFTPSGAGTAARVTKPAGLSEGETHWELWGSTDNVTYYKLATTVVGTTTYDDSAAPSTYSAGTLAPDTGDYTAMSAGRYVAVADNRVFLAGTWNGTASFIAQLQSRVVFTPVFGTTGEGDDERIPTSNYVDVDRTAHGRITGLLTLFGSVFVVKQSALYKLVRTGEASTPYVPIQISDRLGAMRQAGMCAGEDIQGNPCVYWVSPHGVHRWGPGGIETLTDKIRGYWDTLYVKGGEHLQYYAETRQLWAWVCRSDESTPNTILVCYLPRQQWWTYTGSSGASATTGVGRATCSAMFAETPGSTMSYRQKPWAGLLVAGPTPTLVKCDTGSQDNSVSFQAQVRTGAFEIAGPMKNSGVTEAQIHAKVLSGQSLRLTLTGDLGAEARTVDVSLTAGGTETRIVRKIEDAMLTSAQMVQATIGDASAVNSGSWELDALELRVRTEQVR
jgi:hypothetical protein